MSGIQVQLSWARVLSQGPSQVYRPGLQSSRGSVGQTHAVVAGRNQFLVGCWTEGLGSTLAVGWRPSKVPCSVSPCRAAHSMAASFVWRACWERGRAVTHCNLSLKLAFSHFGYILFVWSNSLGPAHIQGVGIIQGYVFCIIHTRRPGPWGRFRRWPTTSPFCSRGNQDLARLCAFP